ncbi:MAG TPA: zf-HC2 domain-containing protein [Burkholderiales bacterium]|nr:zf-HC2 domain-containing protein [Burkholderiales bacterium]
MRLIPSCREVSELLSQAQDRPLTLREKFALHVHLPLCEACRNFRSQLPVLRAAMRRYLDREDAAR